MNIITVIFGAICSILSVEARVVPRDAGKDNLFIVLLEYIVLYSFKF